MDKTSLTARAIPLRSKSELCGLWLALLILEASSESSLYNVFLNSYSHCGHDKTFEVRPDRGYVVRADVSPNTGTKSFRDCETNFYSKRDTGRLCIVQEGKMNGIDDHNAELLVHDGYSTEDAPMIFSLKYLQGGWMQREYCTKSPYVNFYLRKIDKNGIVDIRKVDINLKVLDIESRDRKLYFDDIYCNHTYPLMNSQVSVFNRASQNTDLPLRNLTDICSLKMEKESNNNKSLCFVYVPSNHVTCSSSSWMFTIYTESQNLVYKLQCHDLKAKELHAWCSNNMTHSLNLHFQRDKDFTWDSPSEVPEMLRYVFADYNGSPESFLEKVKRDLLISNENSGLEIGWIVCIVLVLIILLVLIAIFFWKRPALPCVQYKAVLNPGNAASL